MSFSQISLSRFSKDEQFFVLRFDLCQHGCNHFKGDVKWQVQREKFMKKGASAFFRPVTTFNLQTKVNQANPTKTRH